MSAKTVFVDDDVWTFTPVESSKISNHILGKDYHTEYDVECNRKSTSNTVTWQ